MNNFERIDGRLQLNTQNIIIKEYTADEIFANDQIRPMLSIMPSGCGKTYMNADIFRACLNKEGYNQFNYITTRSSHIAPDSGYIRNQIIPQCVITKDHIQAISDIVADCDTGSENMEDLLKSTAEQVMTSAERDIMKQHKQNILREMQQSQYSFEYLCKNICNQNLEAVQLLTQIIKNSTTPQQFKNNIDSIKPQIEKILGEQLDNIITFDDQQVSKLYILNAWKSLINKIYDKCERQSIEISKEIIKRKVELILQEQPQLLQEHQTNGKTANKEFDQYLSLIVNDRRICLIMDDISHILAGSGGGDKILVDGKLTPCNKAFSAVFNRIFNQGRHFGTIIISIHTLDTLGGGGSNLTPVSTVILSHKSNLGQTKNIFISKEPFRSMIQNILGKLKIYNESNKAFYNLICYNDKQQSPDGDSNYVLYQAKTLPSEQFNLDIYKKAPYFYLLAQQHVKKQYGEIVASNIINQAETTETKSRNYIDDIMGDDAVSEQDQDDQYSSDTVIESS